MKSQVNCKNLRPDPPPEVCMEHYGCIYENNHLITLLVDPVSGEIVDANRAACSFYGYTLRQMRQMNITDLSVPVKEGEDSAFLKLALAGSESSKEVNRQFQQIHRLSGGRLVDVEIHTGLITMLGRNCIYSVVHDVTLRVRSERLQKESEARYRDLVELCPEPIMVHRGGTILFANKQTAVLFGVESERLIGRRLENFLDPSFLRNRDYRKLHRLKVLRKSVKVEASAVRSDGRMFYLEIAGAPITYQSQPAVQLVLRDVTESRQEIKRAVRLQESLFAETFPLPEKVRFKSLYVPAETLSGDFYFFQRISDEEAIGILGDVTGKGIAAALSISAVRMLFFESVLQERSPLGLLQDLNRKAARYMDEEYFAACCFHLNFRTKLLTAAGAGINEFIHVDAHGKVTKQEVPGAPVGMFLDSEFEETAVPFVSGDRFCFYSDGLELLEDGSPAPRLFWEYKTLQSRISESILKDDCTWLSLTIR